MGFASRRTFAALLVAVPVAAACVTLSGTATVAQAADGKVSATSQLKFDPASLTVGAGTKVTWTNVGGTFHTVTGGDGTPDSSSPINGQLPSDGSTYSVTFDKPGTYQYFCQPHFSVGMKGTIVVTAASGGGTSVSATPTTGGGSSAPPASASASASVGAPQEGVGAPTAEASAGDEPPGIAGNKTLESIEAERAAQHGAVSGFRFFTLVAVAFLVILSAAVMFSTRPRRAGR
jgi:plastocyanin